MKPINLFFKENTRRLPILLKLLLSIFFLYSCNTLPDQPWYHVIPEKTSAIFVPSENTTINSLLDSKAGSFFDDITTTAIPVSHELEIGLGEPIQLSAILFYPSENDRMETVWVTKRTSNGLSKLKQVFFRPLYKDHYLFNGVEITRLFITNLTIFAVDSGENIFYSESSKALEDIISAHLNLVPTVKLSDDQIKQSDLFILNSEKADLMISQYIAVKYKPHVLHAFEGLGPVSLKYQEENSESIAFTVQGLIPLTNTKNSVAVALSTQNEEFTLDQYIPIDAAFFSAHFSKPQLFPVRNPSNRIDSMYSNSNGLLSKLRDALDDEIAIAGFAPTGLVGVGENLFIRKVKDSSMLFDWLKSMESDGLISSTDRSWYIRSEAIADVISSNLSAYDTFYLTITSEAVVISPRLGLANKVRSDRSRRRVISFNKTYSEIRSNFSQTGSTLFYLESASFEQFIQHYLNTSVSLSAFTSKFELLAGLIEIDQSSNSLVLNVKGFSKKRSNQPFEERWIAPYDGENLTGKPIIADIGGNNRPEIIAATDAGAVIGIAGDGTSYFNATTGSDTPLGSPVVFDWYGNGQIAILIAAGNKIYAWNSSGKSLPKFPITLSEQVSAPLVIADINRDGVAEMVVTTSDRFIHVLDGRGEPLKGWPVQTSAQISISPYFEQIANQWALFAQAENGLFAYDSKGSLLNGFPVFISAPFSTNPITFDNGILLGGGDGMLYYLGEKRLFIDSLNVLKNTPYDSVSTTLRLSARYLSNSSLNAPPLFEKRVTVKTDSVNKITEDLLITQSSDGSLYAINKDGDLRFTISMGQPSSNNAELLFVDIQKDGKPEIIATAGFGRLYAWDIYSGNRYFDLPTNAINYPILKDIDNDGFPELIAQTRGGIRCWTLYGTKN